MVRQSLFLYALDKLVRGGHGKPGSETYRSQDMHWIAFIALTLECNATMAAELLHDVHLYALARLARASTMIELPRMLQLWRLLASSRPIPGRP
jgi:hypothetical protein